MRVDVKKFLFIGLEIEKDNFFAKAQQEEIIHFINTNPGYRKETPEAIQEFAEAIKVLREQPPTDQEEIEDYTIAEGLASKIIQLKTTHNKLLEEERLTKIEITRVGIFGDFSLEDLENLEKDAKRKIQFFCGKNGIKDEGNLPDEVLYVGSEHGLDYFIAINSEPKQYEKLSEIIIPQPVGSLKRRLTAIQKECSDIHNRLKGYAKYNTFLHHALIHTLNSTELQTAKEYANTATEKGLFTIEGWVPVNKIDQMYKFVHDMNVYVEEIAVESTDFIPTCLQNTGYDRVGEDLVHIYDTPSHTDKDPSFWVISFFALFFAMIVGDAGYGLIFLSIAIFVRFKYGKLEGGKKRFLSLITILALCTIGWGLLTTSFFGIRFGVDNPIRKISVINWLVEKKAAYHMEHKDLVYKEWVERFPQLELAATPQEFLRWAFTNHEGAIEYSMYFKFADQIILEIALLVGVIHIIISFLRYLDRNWAGIGWIALIIGAYLYIPFYLNATSIINFVFDVEPSHLAEDGLYLIEGGFIVALLLSIIKHKFAGVLEGMTLIQIFADSMSYLRLYALGLAGAMVMETINGFAIKLPIVLGAVLFLVGHATNIALAIMGGVIHGLRLNFLEWYHYSFEGGGKKFNPLRLLKIE